MAGHLLKTHHVVHDRMSRMDSSTVGRSTAPLMANIGLASAFGESSGERLRSRAQTERQERQFLHGREGSLTPDTGYEMLAPANVQV